MCFLKIANSPRAFLQTIIEGVGSTCQIVTMLVPISPVYILRHTKASHSHFFFLEDS